MTNLLLLSVLALNGATLSFSIYQGNLHAYFGSGTIFDKQSFGYHENPPIINLKWMSKAFIDKEENPWHVVDNL